MSVTLPSLNSSTRKNHRQWKVSFSLVWNYPTGWVLSRKRYLLLLYMRITFPMTTHSPLNFFLLYGFTHWKYAEGKEYKLCLRGITGLHIAAQQSWTASSTNAQRELPYLWHIQPCKSMKAGKQWLKQSWMKYIIWRGQKLNVFEAESLNKWGLCNPVCLGEGACDRMFPHTAHTRVWSCWPVVNGFC